MHFRGADGLARVKVGAATAVDQNGQSWPLTVQAEDDTLQIEVPAAVLLAAAYPLAIDPLISAEFGLDQPVEGPTPSTQSAPPPQPVNRAFSSCGHAAKAT